MLGIREVISYENLIDIINNYKVDDNLIGKLVSGITNNLYDGLYRIIGINHDGSTNTVDLITEDCTACMVFGTANRHYNDFDCTVRKYVENIFIDAFSNDVTSYLKPMVVEYYYKSGAERVDGTLQINTAYGKLLSYDEIGYGIEGPCEYTYALSDKEGNIYPYYDNTSTSLHIKKYNGNAVNWWLRSRYANSSNLAGHINTDGSADYDIFHCIYYVAPVIRLGSKNDKSNNKEDTKMETQDDKVISFDKLKNIVDNENVNESLVGTLVSGINNVLYDGLYRIIGINHDETNNTVDLITEDCVASMVFGSSNRHYDDSNCTVRKYVEETFYKSFSSDVESYLKPMRVDYYYDTGNHATGTVQTNIAYCKLLSFNEIGYGIDGPSKYDYAPDDKEGNIYPYYNNDTQSIRIKKYDGRAVYWWLRSRLIDSRAYVGLIHTKGFACGNGYGYCHYVAPVIRIGSKSKYLTSGISQEKKEEEVENIMKDNVNHPSHYTETSLECIEAMNIVFGTSAVIDFCTCNAWKYVWRWKSKNGKEDLEKANWYIDKAYEFICSDLENELHFDKNILSQLKAYVSNELYKFSN